MTTGERIRERRKVVGMSADDLAQRIGVSRSTMFRYENGDIEKMPMNILYPIAAALNTTIEYLMGWDENGAEGNGDTLHYFDNIYPISSKVFPVLGDIACGQPITVNEEKELYVTAGTDIHADFCLRCKGDSMIGARIYDGDIVFIRKQEMVDNGEIAAVIINDEATLKRVSYFPDQNIIILKAENPKYADLIYSGEQLDHITILGKAVAFQSDIR